VAHKLFTRVPLAVLLTAPTLEGCRSPVSVGGEIDSGCSGQGASAGDVILCEDFEDVASQALWAVGSTSGTWPTSEFVLCQEGFGFQDRCAAWSNHLVFDGSWGFWGYDAWRAFLPATEYYVRWYQYISDPYVWGTLEDKALLVHDSVGSITAYVGTNRNHLPVEPNSGPGMPFVANYQDLDWPDTGGRYSLVNRFQNQGNNVTLQPGRWYLFEWHIMLNTPGVSDGVTRLWIDDATQPISRQTLRMHYTDMRWLRGSDAGKHFTFLRLTTYHQRCDSVPNTCPPNGPRILLQSQRWDRVVLSRRPIGPARAGGPDRSLATGSPVGSN
jgi:hypothetical protein